MSAAMTADERDNLVDNANAIRRAVIALNVEDNIAVGHDRRVEAALAAVGTEALAFLDLCKRAGLTITPACPAATPFETAQADFQAAAIARADDDAEAMRLRRIAARNQGGRRPSTIKTR